MVARSHRAVVFPARFQLVLAANPCPCAAARDVDCTCASGVRRRYLSRLSGPLLDRVDIQVTVQPLDAASLSVSGRRDATVEPVESTAQIVPRVVAARERSAARWARMPWRCNAEAPGPAVRAFYADAGCDLSVVDDAARMGRLTGRGYDRVLRLALTAADLAGRDVPDRRDVRRALALRCGDAA
jgi:magnesium chelatase family protein